MKPPQGLALVKFPEGFDTDVCYQLRERDPLTLEDMQRGAISVEANLNARRARLKVEKKVTYKDEARPSTSDSKIDSMARTMERMMSKINMNERADPKENQTAPQNKNQNQNQKIRRNPTQIRQRGPDKKIRPPFQQKYVDED